MNKRVKFYTLISASVALALSMIMVFQTKETVMPIVSTDIVEHTLSFNRANLTSDYYDGIYTNTTEATFVGGNHIWMTNRSTAPLSANSIARINSDGNNHRILFEDENWGGMSFIQDITSFNITFVEGFNNGTLNITCWKDQNIAHYNRQIVVENGVLQSAWPIDHYRNYSIQTTEATLEVASITIGYSCQLNYEDPIDPANQENVTIMVSNDFHGMVPEVEDEMLGLKKFGTYFKQRAAEDNTLWLDQGDSWQGTIYSNMNYGALVNNVMAYAGCDARTVGNHDFDWGVAALKANTARIFEYNEVQYTVPTLAANIYGYDFENKSFDGKAQESEIGAKTVTYTLENGLKVGIVGVIGEDQITSINSLYTHDIGFKPHVPIIIEEATNLRNAGCDIVICSIHADQDAVIGQGLENYVDLVLCGHSHQREYYVENGLLFFQCGRNGECFGQVDIIYSTVLDNIYTIRFDYLYAADLQDEVTVIDPVIDGLVDTEIARCDTEGAVTLATGISGTFRTNEEGPNLVARAIYDYAKEVDHVSDIDLVYVNNSRSALSKSTWTYADVYQMFPFDNVVFVTELTGKEIYNEFNFYNWMYSSPDYGNNDIEINMTSTYKVAILDYLLYHTNSSRYYDYFPVSADNPNTQLSKNYRDIMKWWLETNEYDLPEKNFSSSEFTSSQVRHNKNKLSYDIYDSGQLDYNTFKVGTTFTSPDPTATYLRDPDPSNDISLHFTHSTIVDKSSYGEFGLDGGDQTIEIEKSGYHIIRVEIKIYNTYDNVNIYGYDSSESREYQLEESRSASGGNLFYTVSYINEDHIIIKTSTGRNVAFFYVKVVFEINP